MFEEVNAIADEDARFTDMFVDAVPGQIRAGDSRGARRARLGRAGRLGMGAPSAVEELIGGQPND
ncbi:hypothetical protein ACWEJ6_48945 [Nonomuraea sp. NPDC004702]